MFNLPAAAIPMSLAFEGSFKPKAWLDKVADPPVWTIGKGLTKLRDEDGNWRDVRPDDHIDEEENERQTHFFFREEIEPPLARKFEGVPLQPHQRSALASLTYNAGASAFPKTTALIVDQAPMADILDEWIAGEWNNALGLYRRRLMEAIVYGFGWPWENAYEATKNAKWSTDWRDILEQEATSTELFDELEIQPRGAQPVSTTRDLNTAQLESREDHGRELGAEIVRERKKVAITPITPKVPIEAVEYLDDKDKAPGNVTVKRVRDAQRGKGAIKQATGEKTALLGAAGSATVAIGAAEPVVKFVDKYPADTIAYVFAGLIIIGGLTIVYGKWQEQKGQDEAEDLMG